MAGENDPHREQKLQMDPPEAADGASERLRRPPAGPMRVGGLGLHLLSRDDGKMQP
jgi:hypothetical protein